MGGPALYPQLQERRRQLMEERKRLPIWARRQELVAAVGANRNLVVVSPTGSGKTTQLASFLLDAVGLVPDGMMIAVSQPRRVAAISVAQRVAAERGCVIGSQVGYAVRFDEKSSSITRIKFATDGMLVRAMLSDADLKRYAVVIVDECHERSLQTDVLQALLKRAQSRRPDLRVIAMSATMDVEKFSSYWNACPVVSLRGRNFPVQVLYTEAPQPDYLEAVVITIIQVHIEHILGDHSDILVFLPGQAAIESVHDMLKDKQVLFPADSPKLTICPLYAALPPDKQMRVFERAPEGHRRIILATNIAETSLTIDGIKFVIDCGLVKKKHYHARTGMDSLQICPVSKAEAWQRAGRAGRQSAGVCYRLYTEMSFDDLDDATIPEILRCNLAGVVLQLKTLGVNNLLQFDWMDRPDDAALVGALQHLHELSALDGKGDLTDLGRRMAQFPLEPAFARILLASSEFDCVSDMVTIVSMLSTDSVFYCPRNAREEANAVRRRLASVHGDHLALLNVYNACDAVNFDKSFCTKHYLSHRALLKSRSIRSQLVAFCERTGLNICSSAPRRSEHEDAIRRCLVTGLFLNAARLQPDGSYASLVHGQEQLYIHPTSALFGQPKPPYVLFTEKVHTSKLYMRDISTIDAAWLPEFAPNIFRTRRNPQMLLKSTPPASEHPALTPPEACAVHSCDELASAASFQPSRQP